MQQRNGRWLKSRGNISLIDADILEAPHRRKKSDPQKPGISYTLYCIRDALKVN